MNIIHIIKHSLVHAIVITGFIFVMMLVIEYLNIQTKGILQKTGSRQGLKSYVLAAVLGAVPGCLGAYVAVTLFSHRMISFGALVTAMIATSGDEAFLMLAMFPKTAFLIFLILFVVGIFAGYLTDKLYSAKSVLKDIEKHEFPIHEQEKCNCIPKDSLLKYLKKPSFPRIIMLILVLILLLSIVFGVVAGEEETWIKGTLILTMSFSLFVLITVPDHFLKEHLWNHVFKKHIPKIFMWTAPTLILIGTLKEYIDVKSYISGNLFIVLIVAVLIGIIPESGPHYVFIASFANGTIPLSILLANSITQDGHGMLPLLAESKKSFFIIKFINIIVGFIIGGAGLILNV